jgi:hypothetical protein
LRRSNSLPIRLGVLFAIAVLAFGGVVPSQASAKAKPSATIFYSATSSAFKAWTNTTSTARPKKSASFGCFTKTVAFYLEYGNAVPKHTQFQILVYTNMGNAKANQKPEASSTKFTAGHTEGLVMNTVTDKPDFEGAYRAVLMIDGHATLHTDFDAMVNGGDC